MAFPKITGVQRGANERKVLLETVDEAQTVTDVLNTIIDVLNAQFPTLEDPYNPAP